MDYQGTVIEESLEDSSVLSGLRILKTRVERVMAKEKTPWLKQWTIHTIEIPERRAEVIAKKLSLALDSKNAWYVDFKNDTQHFIIFRHKIFKVLRKKPSEYADVKRYGISLGIPDYQLDFSPEIQ